MLKLRRHVWLLAVLAFFAPLYVVWAWSDRLGQLGGDAAYYLMMARTYAPYLDQDPLFAAVAASSRFPPLYPLVLALLGGANSLPAAQIITVACLIGALCILYVWQIQAGLSASTAAATVLVVALLPGSYMLALSPQSEYLYLALSLLTLLLLDRAPAHPRCLYGAAVAIAATCLTRAIGIALLPALVVAAVRSGRMLVVATTLLVAVAPLALWMTLHASEHGYVSVLAGMYAHAPLHALGSQISIEGPALLDGFAANILQTSALRGAAMLLCALMAIALVWRALQLHADGIYGLSYLAVLLIWPFPEEAKRFVWVLIPVGFVALALVVAPWRTRVPGRLVLVGWLGVMLLLTLPTLALVAKRYRAGNDSDVAGANRYAAWYGLDPQQADRDVRTHEAIVNGLRRMAKIVPADTCVVSVKPELVNYYAHLLSRWPPLTAATDAEFERELRATGCRYVAMIGGVQPALPIPLYPASRIGRYSNVIDGETFRTGQPPVNYVAFELAELE
jgi:hypothetical protein